MHWETINSNLVKKTADVIEGWIFVDECDSTNERMLELSKTKSIHNVVYICNKQTSGRGTRGRVWYSEPENSVLFSIGRQYEMNAFAHEKLKLLSMVVSLAICEALSEMGVKLNVKWPNDVLLHGKKISGVLVESRYVNLSTMYMVIGIGMNVFSFQNDAVSAYKSVFTDQINVPPMRLKDRILALMLQYTFEWLDKMEKFDNIDMVNRWREYDVFNREDELTFQRVIKKSNEMVCQSSRVTYQGVDSSGDILLLDECGKLKRYSSGEIRIMEGGKGGFSRS